MRGNFPWPTYSYQTCKGTVAVPAVFCETFNSNPPFLDDKQENEQTLTARVMVVSKKLSNKQLREILTAVYHNMAINSKGYHYAMCI